MPTKAKAAPVIEEQGHETTEEVLEDFGNTEAQGLDCFDSADESSPEQDESSWPVVTELRHCGAAIAGSFGPLEPVRLVGEQLLAFYNEKKAAGRTHSEIAYDAGYYTVTKNGQERVMQAQFNEAFLEAQGIETGGRSSGLGRSHAGLTRARVSGQGILLVSQLATRNVGAEPGHIFEVSYPGDGQILLSPTDEVKPVVPRKKGKQEEEPGVPLIDCMAA